MEETVDMGLHAMVDDDITGMDVNFENWLGNGVEDTQSFDDLAYF